MKNTFKNFIFLIICFASVLSSTQVYSQMFWNREARFNDNTWITIDHSASLNITGDFTIEAWINPLNLTESNSVMILEKMSADNTKGYSLYIHEGRVAIRTNGITRLIGKTQLLNNRYTRISASLENSIFRIYINGSTDTSVTIAGEEPLANTDSLFIGKGFNDNFRGDMDEVRIWNENHYHNLRIFYRNTIATNSGSIYKGIVLSLPFQGENQITGGNYTDYSGLNNVVRNRGTTLRDLTNTVYETIFYNTSFNSRFEDFGYLSGERNNSVNPTTEITLEAWINPDFSGSKNYIIQTKNNDYSLFRDTDKKIKAEINNHIIGNSKVEIPFGTWTHVAFTYRSSNGAYKYYINGILKKSDTNNVGNIKTSGDSLYISSKTSDVFGGFIDEVRISDYEKTDDEIKRFLYRSIDASNSPRPTRSNVVYNFDGYLKSGTGTGPELFFRNYGAFSTPLSANSNHPVSPLNRTPGLSFTNGFRMKTSDKLIPETGTSGVISDTIKINKKINISDVNLFVALNHSDATQLKISLKDPSGVSVLVFDRNSLKGFTNHVITIFDDSGMPLVDNVYSSFAPVIKPANLLNNAYNGKNAKGVWTLTVEDVANPHSGILYAWGIQINNDTVAWRNADIKVLIEGRYKYQFANFINPDTVRAYLRSSHSPYNKVDSSTVFLKDDGLGEFSFESPNLEYGTGYYVVMNHRNSIETWSKYPVSMDDFEGFSYDFINSDTSAYGNNLKFVDSQYNRYAMYSGDVNQDGNIDGVDLSLVDNDAFNFAEGYVSTDIDGNFIVDALDLSITDDNSFNFVSMVRP